MNKIYLSSERLKTALLFLLILVCSISFVNNGHSAMHDKVAAYVEDDAITLSELLEQHRKTAAFSPDIKIEDVLNTMINRVLLLRDAKHYRIEASTKDEIIKEYMDLKIRAFIRIGEPDIEKFYNENRSSFSNKEYDDVHDDIERYLTEKELNDKLKEIIAELRNKSQIKIRLQNNSSN